MLHDGLSQEWFRGGVFAPPLVYPYLLRQDVLLDFETAAQVHDDFLGRYHPDRVHQLADEIGRAHV